MPPNNLERITNFFDDSLRVFTAVQNIENYCIQDDSIQLFWYV